MRLEHQLVGGYVRYISPHIINLNHPNIPPKDTFLEKFSNVGNWYFHRFKWGKITTWQEVQAISAEYERSTKMHGAF